jgi:hypothetical protein
MTNVPTSTTTTTQRSSPATERGTGDQAKAEARNVAERGKEGASHVAGEARSQAAGLARTARDEARHRADGEVGKLAAYLDGIGDELGEMAKGSERNGGHLSALASDGSRMANQLSRRLETGGLDGALHDVGMFARRRPGVFLAAAVGVGLALGRVTRNADLHEISDEMKHSDEADSYGTTAGGQREPMPQYRSSGISQPTSTSTPSSMSETPASGRMP